MTKLFTVMEAFDVPGRGVAIFTKVDAQFDSIQKGNPIEIVLRSGARLKTSIKGIEMLRGTFGEQTVAVLLEDRLPTAGMEGAEVLCRKNEN